MTMRSHSDAAVIWKLQYQNTVPHGNIPAGITQTTPPLLQEYQPLNADED